jgi:hypothetical protein
MITMLRGQRQFQQEKNVVQVVILYYPCFMGQSYPMLPSSRSYVKRLELDWTPLLKSETGPGRLDSPDSDEIWDWQTRLRGDWIPRL